MHEAGDWVRVRMLMLGKASVAHVEIKAFRAAMAHAGDILLEAMIASHSNMNAFGGSSTGCRGLGGICWGILVDCARLCDRKIAFASGIPAQHLSNSSIG